MNEEIDLFLRDLEQQGLQRSLKIVERREGVSLNWGGKEVIQFSSNDYLGLANEEFLKKAACAAVEQWGTGSGAARLICGNLKIHETLEEVTATWKGTESSLIFSSGFAVPMGVIPACVGNGDTIILDKLCHACLIDAAKLSGATVRVFPHENLDYLEKLLKEGSGKKWVITESVFSMDGDRASLKKIVELKEKYGAMLMVDEAHASGLLGENGAGLVEYLGLRGRVDLQMGTYSKALGSVGGYVACSRKMRDYFIHRARAFIYSTGNSPVSSAVSLEAIRWIQTDEGKKRRERLHLLCSYLDREIQKNPHLSWGRDLLTPIFPLLVGESQKALELSQRLMEEGFLAVAIRYPTVPLQKARLRVSLSALHQETQIDAFLRVLNSLWKP